MSALYEKYPPQRHRSGRADDPAPQDTAGIISATTPLRTVLLALAVRHQKTLTSAPAPHVTAENVAAIAVLGIIGTGFAYVLNYQIITSEGVTVASTVTYLLPVVPEDSTVL